jgi:hypothetical protein
LVTETRALDASNAIASISPLYENRALVCPAYGGGNVAMNSEKIESTKKSPFASVATYMLGSPKIGYGPHN